MGNAKILHSGESAGAQARLGTAPPHRTLVVDDDLDIPQASAEVLIRHAARYSAKSTSVNREQSQAENAASEGQL